MSAPTTATPRPPGRPRDEDLTDRFLATGRRLLVARGPHRLNPDLLAAEVNAGKASFYRRWSSIEPFLGTVLRSAFVEPIEPRLTGDPIEDLVAVVDRHVNGETGAVCAVLACLMPYNVHIAAAWNGAAGPRDFLHLDVAAALRRTTGTGLSSVALGAEGAALVADLAPLVHHLRVLRLATGLQDVELVTIRARVASLVAPW